VVLNDQSTSNLFPSSSFAPSMATANVRPPAKVESGV
jgi:hypothetical protein